MTQASNNPNLSPFCQRYSIGLTGGIASGKSTVADRLASLGAAVVDTDAIAHTITRSGGVAMPHIQETFGASFVNEDGSLRRSVMREHVFANPAARQRLEAILHPLIHIHTRALGASIQGPYVVFVVPLLVESAHWRQQVNRVVVVDCDPAMQLERLLKRPGITAIQAQQIMAAQASRSQRLSAAHDVIHNETDMKYLHAQIDALHQRCLQASAAHGFGART